MTKIKTESRKGLSLSPGIAIGRAFIVENRIAKPDERKIENKEINNEFEKLTKSVELCENELLNIEKRLKEIGKTDSLDIIKTQRLILKDIVFIEEIKKTLEKEKVNVESVVYNVIEKYYKKFSEIDDEYMRQRALDIRDVGSRLMRNLNKTNKEETDNAEQNSTSKTKEDVIIVTNELFPTFTSEINDKNIIAIITKLGNITSHAAIIARNLGIPAISGIDYNEFGIVSDDILIVDALKSSVHRNPSEQLVEQYNKIIVHNKEIIDSISTYKDKTAILKEGEEVHFYANIDKVADVYNALQKGAAGVGLYRTEYLYISSPEYPDEEKQFSGYKKVAQLMEGNDVIIRTLDIGGDKSVPYLNLEIEPNPFMGYRSIRYLLDNEEVFIPQLRAILRASVFGKVKILIPMISRLEEIIRTKKMIDKVKNMLSKENIPFNAEIPFGVMIEVPLAALNIRKILSEVDFVSVGSNDLVQYMSAADRGNAKVANIYIPHNPVILEILENIVKEANFVGKPVSICGEIAGVPRYLLLLIGMGYRHFSVSPSFIPLLKKVVLDASAEIASKIYQKCKKMDFEEDILNYLEKEIRTHYKYAEIFDI